MNENAKSPEVEELAACRLREAAFRFSRCVSCEYQEDCLVLRGQVPSYYLKQIAQTVVAKLPGVKQIDNQIQVFSEPSR